MKNKSLIIFIFCLFLVWSGCSLFLPEGEVRKNESSFKDFEIPEKLTKKVYK